MWIKCKCLICGAVFEKRESNDQATCSKECGIELTRVKRTGKKYSLNYKQLEILAKRKEETLKNKEHLKTIFTCGEPLNNQYSYNYDEGIFI